MKKKTLSEREYQQLLAAVNETREKLKRELRTALDR
jgi:hypothetical protein